LVNNRLLRSSMLPVLSLFLSLHFRNNRVLSNMRDKERNDCRVFLTVDGRLFCSGAAAKRLCSTCREYMTFAGGFAEANVAKPEAIAEHHLPVGG
jgi:hypothetical protein